MNVISAMNERPFGRLTAIWILATVVSIAGVVIAPIATFVLMISAFGLPHVLYELRYCDERFSARAPVRALAIIGVLLAVIAAARIGNGAHLIPAAVFVPVELSFGAALAFTAAYFMRENRVLGAAIGLIFALGATFAPIPTFLIWAWLHNLTPMGFVAEITHGAERRRWLMHAKRAVLRVAGVGGDGRVSSVGSLCVRRHGIVDVVDLRGGRQAACCRSCRRVHRISPCFRRRSWRSRCIMSP